MNYFYNIYKNNKMLNELQQKAFDLLIKGKSIFMTGAGGTGKSFLIDIFRNNCRGFKRIAITSTTGVSALLVKGTTLHSFLGIGIGKASNEILYKKIIKNSRYKNRWIETDILIIDEISMLSAELFDKLECLARLIRKNDKPFGGIQLVLTGDFLQLPPVKDDLFCFEAKTWDSCVDETVYFTEIIRQDDNDFKKCLNEIRMGYITEDSENILKTCVDKENKDTNIIPTKIFSLNREVDLLNKYEMEKIDEDIYEYDIETEVSAYGSKSITTILKNCNAVENLQLCKGAQVMLLINLDLENGLVNGSRGVITDFIEDIPKVRFLNGQEVIVDYFEWKIEEDDILLATITQIPLKVAYAISAHKAQGMTLDCAEIDLSNVFTYGQTYVALSRVRNLNGLYLKNYNKSKIKSHPKAVKFYKNLK